MEKKYRRVFAFVLLLFALFSMACGAGEKAKDGIRENVVINGVPVLCTQDGMTGVCPNAIRTVNGNK